MLFTCFYKDGWLWWKANVLLFTLWTANYIFTEEQIAVAGYLLVVLYY